MYKKGGRKAGQHNNVQNEKNILALLYIVVQLYKLVLGWQFRSIPKKMTTLNVVQYAHLPSNNFLCVLDEIPKDGRSDSLIIRITDFEHFRSATEAIGAQNNCAKRQIVHVMKSLNKRTQNGKKNDLLGDDDEEI